MKAERTRKWHVIYHYFNISPRSCGVSLQSINSRGILRHSVLSENSHVALPSPSLSPRPASRETRTQNGPCYTFPSGPPLGTSLTVKAALQFHMTQSHGRCVS